MIHETIEVFRRYRWPTIGAMAILVVGGLVAVVLIRGEPEEPFVEYKATPEVSGDDNAKVAHMWNDIWRRADESKKVGDADIQALIGYAGAEHIKYVRSWGLTYLSEFIRQDMMISDTSKEAIDAAFLSALVDDDWRVRRSAIASIQGCGMLRRPEMREAVMALAEDPRPEVASRVIRIDWTRDWNGGEGG